MVNNPYKFQMDGIVYDAPIVDMSLDTEFKMKFLDQTSDGSAVYELDGIYLNQSITFGVGDSKSVLMKLWRALSEITKEHDISHEIVIFTPMGRMRFTMIPNNFKVQVLRLTENNSAYWTGLSVNFTAQRPCKDNLSEELVTE